MKTVYAWLITLLFGVTFAGAAPPEQELSQAAKSGNVEAIQAALKAGVNVNTKFDIGKTALILAAERGRNAAVEALIDAGADLYALDNNNWDALAHAGEGQHISTFKLLLAKGFDPSKNNWRALTVMQGLTIASPFVRRGQTRAVEAQRILEGMYADRRRQQERRVAGSSAPATVQIDMAEPILIDVSERKITAEMFQAAATRAFLGRGWKITKSGADQVAASLMKDQEYRAAIVMKPSLIRIGFVDGFGSNRPNWLINLKQDLERELGGTAVR